MSGFLLFADTPAKATPTLLNAQRPPRRRPTPNHSPLFFLADKIDNSHSFPYITAKSKKGCYVMQRKVMT